MASPYILLSIVTSLGLGMKVSIMAEIVAGGSSAAGLGRLIYIANSIDGDTTQVMALSLAAILIIAIIDLLIFLVKRKMKSKGLINA
jgi:ABC-type nitrate/sulfonate/bicarbonate transport system permease component